MPFGLSNAPAVFQEVRNIDTKQSNKRNNQNSKDKTITYNKETQMTGQHEPL